MCAVQVFLTLYKTYSWFYRILHEVIQPRNEINCLKYCDMPWDIALTGYLAGLLFYVSCINYVVLQPLLFDTVFNFYMPIWSIAHWFFLLHVCRHVIGFLLVFHSAEFSFDLVDIILLVWCRMIFFLTPFLHSFGHWVHKVSDNCCNPWNLFLCMVCFAEALAS